MKAKAKLFMVLASLVALLPFSFGLQASEVSADSAFLFDSFYTLPIKPDTNAKWWVINWGADEFGYPLRVEDYCGSSSCVTQKVVNGTTLVELSQTPDQVAGLYYNAELAELQTGFAYGQPTSWNPEPLKPVVLSTRVRWSENYKVDGSGNTVGSSGIWLWNSPADLVNGQFYPANAIGIQWVDDQSVFNQGLNLGVYTNSFPEWQVPVTNIDMSDWNNFTFIWSESFSGVQSLTAFVNGVYVGTTQLSTPLSDLSVEIWNDNQRPTWEGVTYDQALEEQYMQVDYVSLFRI